MTTSPSGNFCVHMNLCFTEEAVSEHVESGRTESGIAA